MQQSGGNTTDAVPAPLLELASRYVILDRLLVLAIVVLLVAGIFVAVVGMFIEHDLYARGCATVLLCYIQVRRALRRVLRCFCPWCGRIADETAPDTAMPDLPELPDLASVEDEEAGGVDAEAESAE